MMTLEQFQVIIETQKAERESELRRAFSDTTKLRALVHRDAAELVAGIGGYTAPTDKEERGLWIKKMLLTDPAFVAKVAAAVNLIREYAEGGLR